MAKKRKVSSKFEKDPVKHTSRLTYLFVLKILISFLCVGVAIMTYWILNTTMDSLIAFIISLAIAFALYLAFMVKILQVLKV